MTYTLREQRSTHGPEWMNARPQYWAALGVMLIIWATWTIGRYV